MDNPLMKLANMGQNRAPNTIKLRTLYNQYRTNIDSDEEILNFEQWAKKNHPNMKILNQGG